MAAYAALVSVMHIIETLQNHPRPPISLDKEQLQSLTQKITFLQEFLETHSIDDGFEGRIADAAYAAEDVIESHIVDQINATTNTHKETTSYVDVLYNGLYKVIRDLDLIQGDAHNFTKKAGIKVGDDDQLLHNNYSMPGGGGGGGGSLRRSHFSSTLGQDDAVGLDDILVKVMDKLTCGGHRSNRQIIPIVGMGGIGKTTLASNLYVNSVIVQHFDFRGWATISQEYNSKEILLEILLCVKTMEGREGLSQKSEDELGNALHKSLFGRRYLIVLDDIWSIEAWDRVKAFFPDTNDGSAIMLTTRLSILSFQLSGSYDNFEMSFLDKDKSWNLFCKSTFGEKSCPRELEDVGKKIVENCKGLPLSIVVVGGLLAKSKRTREYWLYVAGNLNPMVNLKDNEHCFKILHLSYKELPVHLKPCFLYMGVFPEDFEIYVPMLMELWIAEGFLKPISGKCLEEVAREYFNELLCRNLVLVGKKGKSGETKSCKIHDLLVDVCVREAQKHNFLCLTRHRDDIICTPRRIAVRDVSFHRTALVRSLTFTKTCDFPKFYNCGLVRVWNERKPSILRMPRGKILRRNMPDILHLSKMVNCRYLPYLDIGINPKQILPFCSFWNLQRLHVDSGLTCAMFSIWKMSQLRHVSFKYLKLLEPPPGNGGGDEFVLRNLHKLSIVRNFKFSEEAIKRIPNIKKLELHYETTEDWSSYCFNNLVQLGIESMLFSAYYYSSDEYRYDFESRAKLISEMHENLIFPRSLKKLTLVDTNLDFGDLGTKIGSLPHLQVLNLEPGSFVGPKWETVEGQFRSLKHLSINGLNLIYWNTESCTHFPCLEHLVLWDLTKLKEIPSEIGETLKSIQMQSCSRSSEISAMGMVDEQKELGNEGIDLKFLVENQNGRFWYINIEKPC